VPGGLDEALERRPMTFLVSARQDRNRSALTN
jgi:hypothetical protein